MSDKILKLSQVQTLYQDLRDRIDALPTDSDIPEVPVEDIRIDNSSIVSEKIANIPIATNNEYGVVKVGALGITQAVMGQDKILTIRPAVENEIKSGNNLLFAITPSKQYASTFYGLAKAAGDSTQSVSANAVGAYTDEAKGAIQKMLGITSLFAPEENDLVANQAYSIGDIFTSNGKLYKATAAIAAEGNIIPTTNCVETNINEVFAKKVDTVLETTLSRGRKANTAIGANSFAFGTNVEASGSHSYATGVNTVASGIRSYAEGLYSIASGGNAHAIGTYTIANGSNMFALGRYNVETITYPNWIKGASYVPGDRVTHAGWGFLCLEANNDNTIGSHWKNIGMSTQMIIAAGNGSADNERSNAYALDWDGNGYYMNNVYVHTNADSTGGTRLATITEVATKLDAAEAGLKVVRLI